MSRGRKGLLQGTDYQTAHELGIAEAHIGFRRMHVHIDLARVEFDEQGHHRMAVTGQHIRIGPAQGRHQQLVPHRAAVDEKELGERVRTVIGGQPRKPEQPDALAHRLDFAGVLDEFLAKHLGDAGGQRPLAGRGGEGQRLAVGSRQFETHMRMCKREAPHHIGYGTSLGPVRLQELEPGGRCEEKVAHLDTGAPGSARRARFAPGSTFHLQRPRVGFVRMARGNGQARHGPDGGQRLATESEAAYVEEVFLRQLGGAMPFDGKRKIRGTHAAAIVLDTHQGLATGRRHDGNAPRAGINGVFHQLLDDAGRPLDHFSGRDLIDRVVAQLPDRHGGRHSESPSSAGSSIRSSRA